MSNHMSNHYKAPDGYRYENDGIATDELWLGINDSISNWRLITEEEAMKLEEEQSAKADAEAMAIEKEIPKDGVDID